MRWKHWALPLWQVLGYRAALRRLMVSGKDALRPPVLDGMIFLPTGMFGNVWGHFGLSQLGCATCNLWVEARDAGKHPEIHRTAPHSRE